MAEKHLNKRERVGLIACPRCGYMWVTTSRLAHITCPSCMYKVRNPYWRRGVFNEQAASKATA